MEGFKHLVSVESSLISSGLVVFSLLSLIGFSFLVFEQVLIGSPVLGVGVTSVVNIRRSLVELFVFVSYDLLNGVNNLEFLRSLIFRI